MTSRLAPEHILWFVRDAEKTDLSYQPGGRVARHERPWRGLVWERRNGSWHLTDYQGGFVTVAWLVDIVHADKATQRFELSTLDNWEEAFPNPNPPRPAP